MLILVIQLYHGSIRRMISKFSMINVCFYKLSGFKLLRISSSEQCIARSLSFSSNIIHILGI